MSPSNRNQSITLLLFFIIAGGVLLVIAATCGLTSFITLSSEGLTESLYSLNIIAAGAFWCAILLLPGIRSALRRSSDQPQGPGAPVPSRLSGKIPFLAALLLYPLVLLLGMVVTSRLPLGVWALPFLHILAATIPVYVFSQVAINRLEAGAGLRRWGMFGLGLVLGPGLILTLEIGFIGLVGLGFIIQLSANPSRATDLMLLAQRLEFAQSDPALILNILRPYLLKPMVLYGTVAFVTVIVPLIEELLKPIGVWFLAGKILSPEEGFTAGILSGAGYALFENLFITSPGSEWSIVSIGRIGTTVMHLLTAGIVGYALASAWRDNRFLRLGVFFIGAVLIHAAWNLLTILTLAGVLSNAFGEFPLGKVVGQAASVSLLGLFLALLTGLFLMNRHLRRQNAANRAIIGGLPLPSENEPVPSSMEQEKFD